MSDVQLIIVGLISHSLSLAKEAVQENQLRFARIYVKVSENWLDDLKTIQENELG